MEFEKQLSDELCEQYFQRMFGNIWVQDKLELIVFPNAFSNSNAYLEFIKQSKERQESELNETELHFLAQFFGNCLWEVFSNNHTVFKTDDNTEFSIGSWRGSGSFIANFIEKQHKELLFDYMDFYMGHFKNEPEAKAGYQFIFTQLKQNGFDWKYEYPQFGVIDFSGNKKEDITTYQPNKALEEENNKNELFRLIDEINEKRISEIKQSGTPTIIIAYGNVFGNYPMGWEE